MAERPNARLLNSLGRESRGFKSHSLRQAGLAGDTKDDHAEHARAVAAANDAIVAELQRRNAVATASAVGIAR